MASALSGVKRRERRRLLNMTSGILSNLETYVSGQWNIIIDYAIARRRKEPISTGSQRARRNGCCIGE